MHDADVVAQRLRRAGCVFAEEEAALLIAEAGCGRDLEAMVTQRCSGVPLEYVLGWASFCGLRIHVLPGVFVPRRRSEFLAARAVDRCRAGGVAVDLCCGSGALAAVLAARVPDLEIHAADLSVIAVACARSNLGGLAHVHRGDLWDALPRTLLGRVDVVVANAPYVPASALPQLPAEAREHEERTALDGGSDGLDLHRRILAHTSDWLAPSGSLLIEVSPGQVDAAVLAFGAAGLVPLVYMDDDFGVAVVSGARATG